jgi:hypothetical protein
MAFTLTPANVASPIITAIALAAPAATFTGGVELGLKKPTKMTVEPIVVGMSSDNDLLDAVRIKIEAQALQNRIEDLAAVYVLAQDVVQCVTKSALPTYHEFTGQTLDDETVLGVEFEYTLKNNEAQLNYTLTGEMGVATFQGLEKTTTVLTWSAGEDPTKRRRPGIQKVLIGGAPVGTIADFNLSIKGRSTMVQGGRPILSGLDVTGDITMAQTTKVDVDAALGAANGNATIACYFWNGDQVNLVTLRGGKIPTVEYADKHTVKIAIKAFIAKGATRVDFTVPATATLTLIDNEAAV